MKNILTLVVALCALSATAFASGFKIPTVKVPTKPKSDIFVPADLPCAYTAYYKLYFEDSEMNQTIDCYQAAYGRYMASKQTSNPQGAVSSFYTILRVDMPEEGHPDSAALMSASEVPDFHSSICQLMRYADPYTEGYNSFGLYALFTNGVSYDSKEENVEYNGQVCTRYSYSDQDNLIQFYVNRGNYFVGYFVKTSENYAEINISYKMTTSLDLFTLDSSFKGCEDYAAIFKKPPAEPNCTI